MKVILGFDDTDVLGSEIGTGKLVRMFDKKLPAGVRPWGVLRHQLLVDPRIPYTSHNSPACSVVEIDDPDRLPELIETAARHLEALSSVGSDPGLCVAREDADFAGLIDFALKCTRDICTQSEAIAAAAGAGVHLSGHGGTNDGIIGAAAAVGLTVYGWSGRFLEFGGLRDLPSTISVGRLAEQGILAVPLDHDASVLAPDVDIHTGSWVSPRLWGGRPVVFVTRDGDRWVAPAKRARDADVAE